MNQSRTVTIVRGVAAAAAVTAIIVGVPYLLATFVGSPVPHGWPTWSRLESAITNGDIPDRFWIGALAIVMWATWVAFTACIVLEAVAAARGRDRTPPELGGLRAGQHGAARLVAAIVLVITMAAANRTSTAAATAGAPALRPAAPTAVTQPVATHPVAAATPVPQTPSAGKQWVVARGDNLWRIAEQTLGAGERYVEIFDLNVGRPQPGGAALRDPSEIDTGWVLDLPADATVADPPAVAAPTEAPTVVLGPGDSLWSVAARDLGAGQRWPEIWALNAGRPQPDGTPLSDPDVIATGTVLRLPADPPAPAVPAPPPQAERAAPTEPATTPPPVPPETSPPVAASPPPANPDRALPAPAPPPIRPAPPAAERPGGGAESGSRVPVPPLAVAGAMLLGAVLWRLRRRRTVRQALRKPGGPVVGTGDLATRELHIRAIAAEDQVRCVDAFTRALWPVFDRFAAGDRPVVVLVRVGDRGIEAVLDRPAAPPDWCQQDSDAQVWRPRPDVGLDELVVLAADRPPVAPALVTVGADRSGSVLANLAWAGTVTVTGEPAETAALLAQAAVELATAPWSYDTRVRVHGPLADLLADVEEVEEVTDLEDLVTAWESPTPPPAEDSDTQVLVLSAPVPAGLWPRLAATTGPGSPVAVFGPGDTDAAGMHLTVTGDRVQVEPIGLDLAAVAVDPALLDTAVALLGTVDADSPLPAVGTAPSNGHGTQPEPAATSTAAAGDDDGSGEASADTLSAIDKVLAPRPVEVRVLGATPTVEGWSGDTRRAREELLVFLAMQDSPVVQSQVVQALWPQGLAESSWRATLSRTRRALDVDGEPSRVETLPPISGTGPSRYQVSEQVGCDWIRFEQLLTGAAGAAGASGPDRVAWLRAALGLVGGQPFGAVKARSYNWVFASPELLARIEARITDAAHQLAGLALERGDADTAEWAARQGQRAVPAQQALYEVRMAAAAHRGDPDAVRRLLTEASRALAAADPLEEIPTETRDVYERCLAAARERRVAVP